MNVVNAFYQGEDIFEASWTDKHCDKPAKTSKKSLTLEQRWLCNKQILIRCHEKLNLSVQKCWKDKMQGLHNIKCIPLGHTSRFPPFILVAEKCCETRFRRSRNTLYVSICFYKRWTFLSFYIIIKTILFRKCFEYAHSYRGLNPFWKWSGLSITETNF